MELDVQIEHIQININDIDDDIDTTSPSPFFSHKCIKWIIITALIFGDFYVSSDRMDELGLENALGYAVFFGGFCILASDFLGKLLACLKSPERPTHCLAQALGLIGTLAITTAIFLFMTTPPDQPFEALYTLGVYSILSITAALAAFICTDTDPRREELVRQRGTRRHRLRDLKRRKRKFVWEQLNPAKRKLQSAKTNHANCKKRREDIEGLAQEIDQRVYRLTSSTA